MKKASVCIAFLLLADAAFSQATLLTDSLYAPSLRATKRYMIILPPAYRQTQRYPVLYLLHGLWGGHPDWPTRTNIQKYASEFSVVIVMPEGGSSWYVNSVSDSLARYEDYIVRDLPAHIRQQYAVDASCQAIAGLSMGGYGALMLGLRHPGQYVFVGGLSSAITVPWSFEKLRKDSVMDEAVQNITAIFGDGSSEFKDAHDVLSLAKQSGSTPYIYLVVGIQDGFRGLLSAHRTLVERLRTRKARYEYHEIPGGHSWQLWGQEIQPLLRRLNEVLRERRCASTSP